MADKTTRREFLKYAGVSGSALGIGNLAFLTRLRAVSAQEARVSPRLVKLNSGIEPLVRLIEDHGGVALINKMVQGLIVENGKCIGVECADGSSYRADKAGEDRFVTVDTPWGPHRLLISLSSPRSSRRARAPRE